MRKKRSDAGSKRPRKLDTNSTTAAAGPLVPEPEKTETSTIALKADDATPPQLQDSTQELEVEAHPS
jgi:hypothetical protein